MRDTPAYHWLVANAATFGFYPYDVEPWHWEFNPPRPEVERRPSRRRWSRRARRVVNRHRVISLARHHYAVGTWLAGQTVDVVCGDAVVEVFHRGVLIISDVARHQPGADPSLLS